MVASIGSLRVGILGPEEIAGSGSRGCLGVFRMQRSGTVFAT